MSEEEVHSGDADGLRRRAEQIARGKASLSLENHENLSPEQTRQALHELRVHQIELEMQNEELRRAQAELEAARARYFDLYDLAPVGYCTLSEQGLILEANLTAAELLGVARGALIKQRLTSFILPQDEDIYYLHRKRLFDTGEPQACELRMVKADGTEFWVHLEASAARDAGGEPVGRVAMSDVTARKGAEEKLRQSEQWLQLAQNAAKVGTWDWNLQTGQSTWSEEVWPLLGLAPHSCETTYENWLQSIHPADRARASLEVNEAARRGVELNLEWRVKDPGGRERWLMSRGQSRRDESGRAVRYLGIIIDITERKLAEVALRESETQLRKVADAVPQLSWMASVQGGGVWYNRRWQEYSGMSPEDSKADGWQAACDPAERPEIARRWNDSVSTGTPFEMVYSLRGAGGALRPFLVRAVPLRDSEGRITLWLGTYTDISEQVRMEHELRQLNRQKDDFLALLGHELRNPLAVLSTASELLAGCNEAERRASLQEMMGRQIQVLRRLVDDLIDLERIQRGQVEIRKEAVPVRKAMETAVADTRALIAERNHELAVRVSPRAGRVFADPVRLKQMVTNLVSNAARYTDPGGRIELSAAREGPEVVIRCRDNGSGIDPEMQEVIFKPFSRLPRAMHYEGTGLGLGLAIVKQLAELQGGSIGVKSAGQAQGSEFTLRLPAAKSRAGTDAQTWKPARRTGVPSSRLKVVMVEDNSDLAAVLALRLEQAGHTVHRFSDARTALSRAARLRPEVLLLDIGLPSMDGYELAAELKKKKSLKGALTIAMSGFARESRADLPRGDFDHYLVKPVDEGALLAILGRHYRRPRVLLVEDNLQLAEVTVEFLKLEGHEVEVASSGQEALEKVEAFQPGIVLADMRLPDMSGLEIARALRANPAWDGKTLIVILTARTEADLRAYKRSVWSKQADLFLSKPLTEAKLDEVLAKFAGLRRRGVRPGRAPKGNSR